MEQIASWIAVIYDGNYHRLLPFETSGDDCRHPRMVTAELMTRYPKTQTEEWSVTAIIETNGVVQDKNLSISFADDTPWVAVGPSS